MDEEGASLAFLSHCYTVLIPSAGYVQIRGRVKDLVIRGGENVGRREMLLPLLRADRAAVALPAHDREVGCSRSGLGNSLPARETPADM